MKQTPWDLIILKLKDELTASDSKKWDKWIAVDENKLLFIEVEKLWYDIRSTVVDYNVDTKACWQELERRMAASDKVKQIVSAKPRLEKPKSLFTMHRYVAAASVVLALFVTASFYLGIRINQGEVLQQAFTNWGGKSKIQLPDATGVWVHTNTTLAYNTNYNGNDRIVKLKGQAYFDVQPDKEKPFIVEADGLKVVVHGTKFSVEAQPEAEDIVVSLKEGSVSLQTEMATRFMKPGDIATYNKSNKGLRIERGDVSLATSWADEEFNFDNMSLGQICRYLNKWYNVNITLKPGLEQKYQYTFRLRSEPLEEILRIMARIHPIGYNFDEHNEVTIFEVERKRH